MTLHVQTDFSIPEETVRVARAAYPHGNTLMKLRDALGTIYQGQTFASLFPHNGRSGCGRFRLSRSCARSGSKTTALRMSNSGGEKAKIFPLLPCSSTHLTRQQAHRGKKRTTLWTGYKVHLTETRLSRPSLT